MWYQNDFNFRNKSIHMLFIESIGHVFTILQQISTYQVTDWSRGPRISDFPNGILDTILVTDHSDTNCCKIDVSISERKFRWKVKSLTLVLVNQSVSWKSLSLGRLANQWPDMCSFISCIIYFQKHAHASGCCCWFSNSAII